MWWTSDSLQSRKCFDHDTCYQGLGRLIISSFRLWRLYCYSTVSATSDAWLCYLSSFFLAERKSRWPSLPCCCPLSASPLPISCNRIRFLFCATSSPPRSQLIARLSVRSSSATCCFVFCWRRLVNCIGYVTKRIDVNQVRLGKGASVE